MLAEPFDVPAARQAARDALEAGKVTLDVKFTFDDAARVTRMRMEVLLPMKW